jgi:predicted RecA/RadA family phage recombinase
MAENTDFLRTIDWVPTVVTIPTGGVNAGEIFLVEDTYYLAYDTYAAAATGVGIKDCENCEIPKSVGTGLTIAAGDTLYLNTTTKVVSKTQGTGDLDKGTALEAATATATHVRGHWKGGTK